MCPSSWPVFCPHLDRKNAKTIAALVDVERLVIQS